ncbi:MAG: hypothetical protein KDK90_20590 [Leptospiraceae bacterium]|nr:hypothetical protein [Leptospiraceae bacterium]
MVENSKNISLKEFKDKILEDKLLGHLIWDVRWDEFVWEDKNTLLGILHHEFHLLNMKKYRKA